MISKRGISGVVAVVLIVLLAVAATGIFWKTIFPVIKEKLMETEKFDIDLSIVTEEGFTVYDPDTQTMCVQVGRGNDETNLSKIKVIFEIQGNSYYEYFNETEIPGPNQKAVKCWKFDWIASSLGIDDPKPDSISLAPIFFDGNVESEGEVFAETETISKGDLSGVDAYGKKGGTSTITSISPDSGESCVAGTCYGSLGVNGCDDLNGLDLLIAEEISSLLGGGCSYETFLEGDELVTCDEIIDKLLCEVVDNCVSYYCVGSYDECSDLTTPDLCTGTHNLNINENGKCSWDGVLGCVDVSEGLTLEHDCESEVAGLAFDLTCPTGCVYSACGGGNPFSCGALLEGGLSASAQDILDSTSTDKCSLVNRWADSSGDFPESCSEFDGEDPLCELIGCSVCFSDDLESTASPFG